MLGQRLISRFLGFSNMRNFHVFRERISLARLSGNSYCALHQTASLRAIRGRERRSRVLLPGLVPSRLPYVKCMKESVVETLPSYRGLESQLAYPVTPAFGRRVDRALSLGKQIFSRLVRETYQRFSQWQQMQRTLRALHQLDDRGLADIGLRRADLEQMLEMRLQRRG